MTSTDPIDAARLALLLNDLRLPAIKVGWRQVAERADKEGWPAARFLAVLAEHEVAERAKRRIERHLAEARLPICWSLARLAPESRTSRPPSVSP
jgi:DNA replication protein DnaC